MEHKEKRKKKEWKKEGNRVDEGKK